MPLRPLACVGQQQYPGGQDTEKGSGERTLRRQKFGGNEVGAAPDQRGKGGGEDDAEAGHAEVSFMSGWAVCAAVFSRFRMADQAAAPFPANGITA